jgi:uncharacterized membrane protein YjjP (DUF1212 family)
MPPQAPPDGLSTVPEVALVLELGRALQEFGVSAPTLEVALGHLARHLDMEEAIYATPTGFLASLRRPGHRGKTYLIRMNAGDSALEKLAEAEALVDRLVQDRVDVATARIELARLRARPSRYRPWAMVGAYGITSMGMANIVGGGWREMLLGALMGLLVGLAVQLLARRRPGLSRLAPLVGGVISSLGGALMIKLLPTASFPILVLCGIIVLIPGLGLLVSMQELGTGNLVAGTSRLAGSFLVFLLLAFGVGLGQRLGGSWLAWYPVAPRPLPPWALIPSLGLAGLGFLVIFQGRPRDFSWTLGACVLAWSSAHLGTLLLGPVAGAGISALILGSACNQYGRRTRRPGAVLLLPSLMLILPGSLELRGLTLMLHGQTLEGLEGGFQAVCVTVALMLGLLLANALVRRRAF